MLYSKLNLITIHKLHCQKVENIIADGREACKESSDETESIAIIFSTEINLL